MSVAIKPQTLMTADRFASGLTYEGYKGCVSYERGICPVAERMWEKELMVTNVCRAGVSQQDLMDVVLAFEKVAGNVAELG